jgi:Fe-S oxidoreductase
MAGTFGFKKGAEGYDVSTAIGNTLFERIKETNVGLIITESSVCKMQIEQGTRLSVNHPAVVLRDIYEKETAGHM